MPFFKNTVVFIRHGQTEWNLQKRTQGHLDSPLSQQGISEAKEFVEKFENYKFDLIVSSSLGRAMQTSKILAEELRIPEIQPNPFLTERNLGVLQGLTKEILLKKFPLFFDANNRFIQNSEIPGGESLQEFLQRIQRGVKELQLLSETKSFIVVTHDGVLHAIVGYVKGIKFSDVQRFYKFGNCEPIIL